MLDKYILVQIAFFVTGNVSNKLPFFPSPRTLLDVSEALVVLNTTTIVRCLTFYYITHEINVMISSSNI